MKQAKDFTAQDLLSGMESSMVRDILIAGIHSDNEAAIFPALDNLIVNGSEDYIRDVLYSMLANNDLHIGDDVLEKTAEFIVESSHIGGELYYVCIEMLSCSSLEDFMDRRQLSRVYLPGIGEYTFISYT